MLTILTIVFLYFAVAFILFVFLLVMGALFALNSTVADETHRGHSIEELELQSMLMSERNTSTDDRLN
jgi:hypothetical protein